MTGRELAVATDAIMARFEADEIDMPTCLELLNVLATRYSQ